MTSRTERELEINETLELRTWNCIPLEIRLLQKPALHLPYSHMYIFLHSLFDFFLPTAYQTPFIFIPFVSPSPLSLSLSASCFCPSINHSFFFYFPSLFTFLPLICFRNFLISSSFYTFPSSIHFFLLPSNAS